MFAEEISNPPPPPPHPVQENKGPSLKGLQIQNIRAELLKYPLFLAIDYSFSTKVLRTNQRNYQG